MTQSRSLARVVIEIKGDIDETTPKIQALVNSLMKENN